ncbi:MAG: hypothetical protein F7C36_02615, partial [Desulfurococcales archaeon]|nr:hypothetical protein [Desulfurococcales archaeon]
IKVSSIAGTSSIPDGFVIDFERKIWHVVEIELKSHGVWSHIIPQVSKHLVAVNNPLEKRKLIEIFSNLIKDNKDLKELITKVGISTEDLWRELENIIDKNPILTIIIDGVPKDLKVWINTIKINSNIIEVLKYKNEEGEVIYYIQDEVLGLSPELEDKEGKQSQEPMSEEQFMSRCVEPFCYMFEKLKDLANRYPYKLKIQFNPFTISIRVSTGQKNYSIFTLYPNYVTINKNNIENLKHAYGSDKIDEFFNKLRMIDAINEMFDLMKQPGVSSEFLTKEDVDLILEALDVLLS